MRTSQGFSLIEILIAIAIVAILATITFTTFVDVNKMQALDKTRMIAVSSLEQARGSSMSAKYAQNFGVHFASSTITFFTGSAYNPSSASNTVFTISPYVVLATTSINGGGSDIVFGRLNGTTTNYGSVVYQLINNATSTKTINVQATGIIE